MSGGDVQSLIAKAYASKDTTVSYARSILERASTSK